MLLASLGLHGLVLFSPVGPSEGDLIPPPDPEEDGIAITKIDAPQPRTANPASVNPSTAKTAPPATAARPPAQAPRSGAAPAASGSQRQPNRGNAGNRGQARQAANTSTTAGRRPSPRTNVPDLSDTPSARNPNTAPPPVGDTSAGQTSRNPATDTSPPKADPFEEYVKVFESYNGVKLSEEDAAELRNIWLESFSDRGPEFTDLEIQPVRDLDPIPYEASICLPGVPETAQLLVLVNSDGELDEYQPFLQRTGYRVFDNAAAELVEKHDFPAADAPKAYLAEVAVDYDEENCQWPPEVDKLPDEYFAVLDNYIGPDLTTLSDFNAAQEEWLKQLSEAEDIELPHTDELTAQEFETFDQSVAYPLEICLPLEPKDSRWGVVVQPDGTLSTEPTPLRSTGYQNFDDRAKQLVQEFKFPTTDEPQLYIVEVPVDYNSVNCQPLDSDSFEVPTTTARSTTNSRTPRTGESSTASTGIRENSESASEGSDEREADASSEQVAFNPVRQNQLIEAGRQQVESDPVGSLNSLPAIVSASLQESWPEEIDQSCFINELTEDAFVPVEAAADAVVLSESADFVPLTLSRLYGAEVSDAGKHCGAPLLKMAIDGTPQLFASTIGFGDGGSSALIILWSTDPREE